MYQLSIVGSLKDIVDSVGSVGSFFVDILDIIATILDTFVTGIIEGIQLIFGMLVFVPNLIVNSMFNELPYIFKMGLTSLFTIFIAMFVLRLFQLVKFW